MFSKFLFISDFLELLLEHILQTYMVSETEIKKLYEPKWGITKLSFTAIKYMSPHSKIANRKKFLLDSYKTDYLAYEQKFTEHCLMVSFDPSTKYVKLVPLYMRDPFKKENEVVGALENLLPLKSKAQEAVRNWIEGNEKPPTKRQTRMMKEAEKIL